MHPEVRRLGFVGRNADLADSFLRACRLLNRPETEGLDVLRWYANTFGANARVGIEDVGPKFEYKAQRAGWSDQIVQASAEWFCVVHRAGGRADAIAPMSKPVASATAQRLGEIRKLRQADPSGWDRNQQLQDEELQLLEHAAALPAPTNEKEI